MPRLTPLPPSLSRPFSVAEARSRGVAYARTRGRDLATPHHGVRVPLPLPAAASLDDHARARARHYAPRIREGQFFSGMTAVALHGLPVTIDREVEVAVRPPRTPPRARGVVGRQLCPSEVTSVRGLPVLGPVDAWVQCAPFAPLVDLVIIGDALVRRARPLAAIETLVEAASGYRGRGGKALRAACALVRARTDSPGETRLRLVICAAGFPEPEINVAITDAAGHFLGWGDLVYPEQRIVIEYEGGYHFETAAQARHDIDRIAAFVRAGWRVIRAHKDHLVDPTTLFMDLRAALG